MTTINYDTKTVTTPPIDCLSMDTLFPTNEDGTPSDPSLKALAIVEELIYLLEEGPACRPITFEVVDPLSLAYDDLVEVEGEECVLAATATDAAGRKVQFMMAD